MLSMRLPSLQSLRRLSQRKSSSSLIITVEPDVEIVGRESNDFIVVGPAIGAIRQYNLDKPLPGIPTIRISTSEEDLYAPDFSIPFPTLESPTTPSELYTDSEGPQQNIYPFPTYPELPESPRDTEFESESVVLPDLPQEIIDLIIDCFDPEVPVDQEALKNCALVCKSWLHRSRFRQLHNIWIFQLTDWELWMRRFKAYPHTPQWVHCLNYNPELVSPLFQNFHMINKLEHLYLESFSLVDHPDLDYEALAEMNCLQRLHLGKIAAQTHKELWQFILAFPNLSWLRIQDARAIDPSLAVDFAHGSKLKHLYIEVSEKPESLRFFQTLLKFPFITSLITLNLTWKAAYEHYPQELVTKCGSSLTQLSLHIWGKQSPEISLAANTSLKVLELSHSNPEEFKSTLLSLPSPCTEVHTIYADYRSFWATGKRAFSECIDWEDIDAELSTRFPGLRAFHLVSDEIGSDTAFVARLKNVHSSGLLKLMRSPVRLWA